MLTSHEPNKRQFCKIEIISTISSSFLKINDSIHCITKKT